MYNKSASVMVLSTVRLKANIVMFSCLLQVRRNVLGCVPDPHGITLHFLFLHSVSGHNGPSRNPDLLDASWEGPGDWPELGELFSSLSQSSLHQTDATKLGKTSLYKALMTCICLCVKLKETKVLSTIYF
jgi:hypothetical protein